MTEFEKQQPSSPTAYGKWQHPGRRAGDRVDQERALAGGGDAGALMRATDWSKTPLGPVTEWSEALRTMVGVLLRNRFPMMLFWGPELVQLYNDAYRPISGAKHPRAMGQPARECWSDIWPIIGPLLAGPLRGEPATASDDLLLLIERKAFLEETHFKFAFSPVPDDTLGSSGIGGVLATVAETTERVYAERQLRTLRELGARAAEATTPRRACELAAETFAENAFDVPFALFYLVEPGGAEARLAASCGFDTNEGPRNPSSIALGTTASDGAWPVRRILETRSTDVICEPRVSPRPLPSGRWSEPPRYALAVPISSPGEAAPYGVMIVGCNPYRELDDGYRTFFELANAQLAAAIRNAKTSEVRSPMQLSQPRGEAERGRPEHVAELQQTVRLAETFISVMGHDLRNPLSAVSTAGALLSRRSESEGAMKLIALILKSSDEMASMIDQLVDFARIRLGRGVELVRDDVNLADLCEQVLAAAEAAHGCSISLSRTGDVVGHWDRIRLRQLVTTLTNNGCRHRLKDSTVLVRLDGSQPSSVTLEVWNAGMIEPERLGAVFEPATQEIDSPRPARDGRLRLGLYLGRQMVMAHGGAIRVESSEQQGTRFLVELPRFAAG